MRIGLLSDVHGNLAALRAVAAALDREDALDHVVVAGDLLEGGPRPREVWALLRERGWALVRGNEDEALSDAAMVEARRAADDPLMRFSDAAIAQLAWSRAVLGATILRELGALPAQVRLPTPAGDLLIVHSSPRSTEDRCGGPWNTLADVTAAYSGTGATAIAFGHYHQSFVRTVPFGLLVNVASVGLPIDSRPLAAYTILTATPDGWIVEQRRVPYEPAEEAAAAAAAGMPPWAPLEPV
jgi:predicted phosphodiesterase